MKIKKVIVAIGLLSTALLSGCGVDEVKPEIKQSKYEIVKKKPVSPVTFTDEFYISGTAGLSKDLNRKDSWLKNKKVSLNLKPGKSISAVQVIQYLRKEGVNITSTIPVQGISYSGYGLTDISLDEALKIIFYSMGLDYKVNNEHQYITILPTRPKTWYVSIGDKTVDYESDNVGGASGNSTSSEDGSTSESNDEIGINKVVYKENFWENLKSELEDRLKVKIDPFGLGSASVAMSNEEEAVRSMVEGGYSEASMNADPSGNTSTIDTDEITAGSYSVNPDTGAVTVRAPSFILDELEDYFTHIDAMYNSKITFEGQLLSVSTNAETSAGIDIAGFARFANDHGFIVRNNVLGGVTVSPPIPSETDVMAGTPIALEAAGAISGSSLGVIGPGGALQMFNAFLETKGNVKTLQEPLITTTSGVPGSFVKKYTTFYNTVTQSGTVETSDTGISNPGVTNELNQVELGVDLKVNPKYDPQTGNVRAMLKLDQKVPMGSMIVKQYLNLGGATGGLSSVDQEIPIVSKTNYNGEVLLKDGDLIIVGGQTEQSMKSLGSGTMGFSKNETPIKYFLGKETEDKQVNTVYFALTVKIEHSE